MGAVTMEEWNELHAIRDEVNKALEETRKKGDIGSALAAEVVLYADNETMPKLTRLGEELRFLLITSKASVDSLNKAPDHLSPAVCGVSIQVIPSSCEKCARCWHRRPDVGQDTQHAELCLRCVGNISGQDEMRQFI